MKSLPIRLLALALTGLFLCKVSPAIAAGYPLKARNYSVQCAVSIAVAYVPQGSSRYVVKGWWELPAPDFTWDQLFDGSGQPIVINDSYPWYFYVDRRGGKRTGRVAAYRTFTIDGQSLRFVQYPDYPSNGSFWLSPSCKL